MANGNGSGMRVPGWMVGMLIPVLMAGAAIYATVSDSADHEDRIRMLETSATRSGDDHMLLIQMRDQQVAMREDLAAIKAKLGVHE